MRGQLRRLAPHVNGALQAACLEEDEGRVEAAWTSLERAHILSQPSAWLHTRVHWAMARMAVRTGDTTELVGQLVRISVAGLGSALGRFPPGNTGRARVRLRQPMPIPTDLQAIFEDVGIDMPGGSSSQAS